MSQINIERFEYIANCFINFLYKWGLIYITFDLYIKWIKSLLMCDAYLIVFKWKLNWRTAALLQHFFRHSWFLLSWLRDKYIWIFGTHRKHGLYFVCQRVETFNVTFAWIWKSPSIFWLSINFRRDRAINWLLLNNV